MESPLSKLVLGWLVACALTTTFAASSEPTETVGHKEGGRSVTPVNQALTPLGRQVELTGLRPQALGLSPDGRRLLGRPRRRALSLDPRRHLSSAPRRPALGGGRHRWPDAVQAARILAQRQDEARRGPRGDRGGAAPPSSRRRCPRKRKRKRKRDLFLLSFA